MAPCDRDIHAKTKHVQMFTAHVLTEDALIIYYVAFVTYALLCDILATCCYCSGTITHIYTRAPSPGYGVNYLSP